MEIVKYLFLLFLVTLPLGQFAKVPVGLDFAGSIYLYDVILPVMIGLWLMRKLVMERSLTLPPLSGRILLFAAIAGLALLNGLRELENLSEFFVSGLYLWRWLMYAGIYFVLTDLLQAFPKLLATSYKLLTGGILFFALVGLLQFVLFPDFSRFVQHGWDPHYYRVLSTFFDPNFAGLYLSLGFTVIAAVSMYGSLESKGSSLSSGISLSALTTVLVALILTFSRSAYLAFSSMVVFLGLLKFRRLLLVMSLVGIVVFVMVPRVQTRIIGAVRVDETAQLRLQNYARTWQIVKANPLLGVGFNTFRFVQEDYGYFRDERGINQPGGHAGAGADNSFLFLWATTGVFGLAMYLFLLWGQFKLGWDNYRASRQDRKMWGLVLAASVIAVSVHSQFVNSLFYPWIMGWMWSLTALNAARK